MRVRSALFLSFVAATAFAGSAQEPVQLRFHFDPAAKLAYSSKTNVAQEMMGTDLSSAVEMTMTFTAEKADQGTKLSMVVSGSKATLPEGAPLPFTAEDMQQAMDSIKTTATYNELGVASDTKVEGNEMAKSLAATMNNLQMGFLGLEYPEKALKVGDTWVLERDFSKKPGETAPATTGAKKTIPVTYTLTKLEDGTATITAATKGQVETEGMGGMPMTVDMDTVTEYQVDVATGLPKTIKTTGSNHMDLGIGQMDQKIDATITRL
jgi:hypothetical protein